MNLAYIDDLVDDFGLDPLPPCAGVLDPWRVSSTGRRTVRSLPSRTLLRRAPHEARLAEIDNGAGRPSCKPDRLWHGDDEISPVDRH
jgi:hypothetical protein